MRAVILDDSKTMRLTLQLLLEEAGLVPSDIALFEEGKEALVHLANSGSDLIFTDVQMPGMDGLEFLTRLHNISPALLDSTVVVSADTHSNDLERMRQLGVRHFIRKPIDPVIFKEHIAPFCGQKNHRQTAQVSKNDAAFDHDTLAKEIGVPVKYIPRLLESFFSESEHHIRLLNTAIAEKNFEQIERSAHTIKGSAGNMKFDALYKQAKLIEIAAHLKDEIYDFSSALNALEGLFSSLSSRG